MGHSIINDIFICIKGLLVISFVWFTDTLLLQVVPFLPPSIREFFIEIKEVISCFVALAVLIVTILKIGKELKNKSC